MNNEVAEKLKKIEKEKELVVKLGVSFAWLAVCMIIFVFLITLLSDFFKLVSFKKKILII